MSENLLADMEAMFQRHNAQIEAFTAESDEAYPSSRFSFADVNLCSDVDIDYSKLHSLLLEGRFRQADKLTYDLMCKTMSKPVGSYFTSEDISFFPDTDLLTIEKLWNYYSNGKFGFCVQRDEYKGAGEDLDTFKSRVGWKQFVFDTNSYPADSEILETASDGFLPCMCNHKGKVFFIKDQIIVHSFIAKLDMILPE